MPENYPLMNKSPEELLRVAAELRAITSRMNGAKSNGPVTPEGKEWSRRNALKHGIYARKEFLTPRENPKEFAKLREQVHKHFAPQDEMQTVLVDRIVFNSWRLLRAAAIEAKLVGNAPNLTRVFDGSGSCERLLSCSKYEAGIERSIDRTIKLLRNLQNQPEQKATKQSELVDLESAFLAVAPEAFNP